MRKLVPMLAAVLVMTLFASIAQAQSFHLFGGYSYVRPSMTQSEAGCIAGPGTACALVIGPSKAVTTNPNLNGWEVSATMKLIPFVGMTADFSGHTGTALGASSAKYRTYLFGPELRFPGPVSPFAHILLGGAHVSTTTPSIADPPYNAVLGAKDTAFASAIGGGIDISLLPFIAFRPIQIDFLTTRFGSSTQNQPRISAGLVLHF